MNVATLGPHSFAPATKAPHLAVQLDQSWGSLELWDGEGAGCLWDFGMVGGDGEWLMWVILGTPSDMTACRVTLPISGLGKGQLWSSNPLQVYLSSISVLYFNVLVMWSYRFMWLVLLPVLWSRCETFFLFWPFYTINHGDEIKSFQLFY